MDESLEHSESIRTRRASRKIANGSASQGRLPNSNGDSRVAGSDKSKKEDNRKKDIDENSQQTTTPSKNGSRSAKRSSSSSSGSDSGSKSSNESSDSSGSGTDSSDESSEELHPVRRGKHNEPGGFIKITKNHYVGRRQRQLPGADITPCDCVASQPCNSSSCVNRSTLVECMPGHCPVGDARCCNMRFQKKQYSPLVPFKAGNKGWGILAGALIRAGSLVTEYVGEVIDQAELERRSKKNKGTKHFYFLTIDANECIDASRKGNLARFINHSCSPNCQTQKWQVGGETCVGIFAMRDIMSGEELTFDYQFERFGNKKQRCLCGSKNCCEWIGGKPKKQEERVGHLHEPKSRTRSFNADVSVLEVLESQDFSGSNYAWTANTTPVFTPSSVQQALVRRRLAEEELLRKRQEKIQRAVEKKQARKRKPAPTLAANSPKKPKAAESSSSSSSDSDSDSDDPVNGMFRIKIDDVPQHVVYLPQKAEKVYQSMVAKYQKFVFEAAHQILDDEHTAEMRRENEAKRRRAAVWMFNINPDRLARGGQVIFDRSTSPNKKPPARDGPRTSKK